MNSRKNNHYHQLIQIKAGAKKLYRIYYKSHKHVGKAQEFVTIGGLCFSLGLEVSSASCDCALGSVFQRQGKEYEITKAKD